MNAIADRAKRCAPTRPRCPWRTAKPSAKTRASKTRRRGSGECESWTAATPRSSWTRGSGWDARRVHRLWNVQRCSVHSYFLWETTCLCLQLAMKHQKEMEQLEKNQREQLEKLEKFNEQVRRNESFRPLQPSRKSVTSNWPSWVLHETDTPGVRGH